ncbi:cysteine proteinase [Dendrothele bispora CBS 962.96]|uniref:Cysteine proteinase n=1 Tax=Dendrothele bispora (strain CBS 962.96) TaxID=1314807 RepID=A0A4S8KS45_DENBC|nr:cysteine proteinase [Dendrothele bispora CBS 962.96]THU90734.1 cysteine proteinase [Dendrothele bispora CBS 962.96]
MGSSKKNKLKKAFSPVSQPSTSPEIDDDELMDDLLAQLDSKDQTVQAESAKVLQEIEINQQANAAEKSQKKDSKSRFLARKAKKAAELASSYVPNDAAEDARLEKEAKQEEVDIKRVCDELGVQIYEINPDGHCLFSAVADQLALLSILPSSQANYATVRLTACNYIYSHPDDFLPFLPSANGEDGPGATREGLMSQREFESYCLSIRDTAVWGGEPEILALSRAYNIPIHVVQSGRPPIVIHNPTGTPYDGDMRDPRVVRISYHRRMYGLGEHYNSLRPKSMFAQLSQSIHNIVP